MHYLVVSPAPIFPTTAGNRGLILLMIRKIRAEGHRVTFLYTGQEEPVAYEREKTLKEVDALHVCEFDVNLYAKANEKARRRFELDGQPLNYEVDDWYDEKISEEVRKLYSKDHFDVMIVNYIWNSKTFAVVPDKVIKIQQTHDKMSNRWSLLAKQGLPPAWFSVTTEGEALALDRADINIALQFGEELYFRSITRKAVFTVQHATQDFPCVPVIAPQGRKLRVGFIGGDNSINMRTIVSLVQHLDNMPTISKAIELRVIGPICRIFSSAPSYVSLMGVQDDIDAVYSDIDVMVNPVAEGTGLKIKSIEALQRHKPIIMTKAGSDGLLSPYHFHCCASVLEVMGYLKMVCDNPSLLEIMQDAGKCVLKAYVHRLEASYEVLLDPQKALDKRAAASKRAKLLGEANDSLVVSSFDDGSVDVSREESVWIGKSIDPTSKAIDIGCGDGLRSVFLSNIHANFKVIAIEFDPDLIEFAKMNAIENGLYGRIDLSLLGYAMGNCQGYGRIDKSGRRSSACLCEEGEDAVEANIPVATLDKCCDLDNIGSIIIDDCNPIFVLSGALSIIERKEPAIFIIGACDENTSAWMGGKGYMEVDRFVNRGRISVLFKRGDYIAIEGGDVRCQK